MSVICIYVVVRPLVYVPVPVVSRDIKKTCSDRWSMSLSAGSLSGYKKTLCIIDMCSDTTYSKYYFKIAESEEMHIFRFNDKCLISTWGRSHRNQTYTLCKFPIKGVTLYRVHMWLFFGCNEID